MCRDHRATRSALFDNYDSIEEGGIRASSSYSRDMDERDNDKAMDNLQDRVTFLKKVSFYCEGSFQNHHPPPPTNPHMQTKFLTWGVVMLLLGACIPFKAHTLFYSCSCCV